MLAHILNYRDGEIILHLATENANIIQYNVVRISFYLHFSAEVQRRRAKFQDVKRHLMRLQLPYAMLYSTRLRVTAKGQTHLFDSAPDAASWLDHKVHSLRKPLRCNEC